MSEGLIIDDNRQTADALQQMLVRKAVSLHYDVEKRISRVRTFLILKQVNTIFHIFVSTCRIYL